MANSMMNDSLMDDCYDEAWLNELVRLRVEELNEIVKAGQWKTDLDLYQKIFDEYVTLTKLGANANTFATPEFWLPIKGTHDWDELFPQQQQGGDMDVDPNIEEEQMEVDEPMEVDVEPRPLSEYYEIIEGKPVYVRKFQTQRQKFIVQLKHTDELTNANEQLEEIFDDIIAKQMKGLEPTDQIGLEINHPTLEYPMYFQLREVKDKHLTGEKILNYIERVLQSHKELKVEQAMEWRFTIVTPPAGNGRSKNRRNITSNIDNWMDGKKCFLRIKNTDDLCLARAVVTAISHVNKEDPAYQYNTIKNGDRGLKMSLQKRKATELMRQAGLKNHVGPCGINEIQKIQDVLPDYQIKVHENETFGIVYRGPTAPNVLYLFLHKGHYDVITSMPAFFAKSYWCEDCEKAYNNREDHRCKKICPCCYGDCPDTNDLILCPDCNRYCRGPQCFENHKKLAVVRGNKKAKVDNSVCDRQKKCKECGEHYRMKDGTHKCGYNKCQRCNEVVEIETHHCYMKPIHDTAKNSDEEPPIYVFYDFEAKQELEIGRNERGGIFKHEPNLCIAHIVCDDCKDTDNSCDRCGKRIRMYEGDNCLDEFAGWLFSDTRKNIIAIAHNAKGYDGQFMMQHLLRNGIKPEVIKKGHELMMLSVGKVRFLDSLNFLPMPLSALPKAFGINELVKGYFPHLFNKAENWNFVGQWPEAKYYNPESMKPDVKEKFDKWYDQQAGKQFDFQEEIRKYCNSDVDILRRCCLKFRDIFMQKTTIDPFEKSLTIASACNRVFRQLYLKEDTIALIPHGGYRQKDRQSIIGIKTMKWISHKERIWIKHARNGGEQRIGQYKVDGIHGKTVYEFYGCYWHGCPCCMKNRYSLTANQQSTAEAAYERTIERQRDIEAMGYKVVEIWECQLKRELRMNPEMKQFFDNITLMEPLDPREAFYGGRTNAVKLYDYVRKDAEGKPLEQIHDLDICSLYPYICKTGKFPIGVPEIITENFKDITTQPYEGEIKCKVLPPQNLLHPLLPHRCNNKLMFPLCRTCCETLSMDEYGCLHDDDERAITGTWVTLELYKAMELGYRVVEIYEVMHYDKYEQYDPNTKLGGLFTEYINKFVQLKQQADGFPSWAKTEEQRDKYIHNYCEKEGIQLIKAEIEKNPGLRALAKLMLNSFWGKFGQRSNLMKTDYFTDAADYFKHINEDGRIIHSVEIINDDMLMVTSIMEDDCVEVMGNTNVVIAAYVTAQARLKLYSYIENLQDRLIYFDTDSIIFKTELGKGQWMPEIGSYLGDMTDELAKEYGEGSYIEEFVSGGPKNYAFKVYSVCDDSYYYCTKVRGFTLTADVCKIVNFDTLKRLVCEFVEDKHIEIVPVIYNQIQRTHNHNIVTKTVQKKYRVVYDKRVVLNDFTTVPYGYNPFM